MTWRSGIGFMMRNNGTAAMKRCLLKYTNYQNTTI